MGVEVYNVGIVSDGLFPPSELLIKEFNKLTTQILHILYKLSQILHSILFCNEFHSINLLNTTLISVPYGEQNNFYNEKS